MDSSLPYQIQRQLFYTELSKLTPEEKQLYEERVKRQVYIGGESLRNAQISSLKSIINIKNYQESVGKTKSSWLPAEFKMMEVSTQNDKKEYEHEQNKKNHI